MTTQFLGAVLLPYLAIAAAALLLGKYGGRARGLVVRWVFALMLFAGIAKQIVAVRTDVWHTMVPLHFSSTFYLTVGCSVFAKNFLRRAGQSLLFVSGVLMTVVLFADPVAVLGEPALVFTSHIRAHGYFFHMAAAFQMFVLLFSGELSLGRYDAHIFALFVAAWCALAIPGAFYFRINFMGILVSYIPLLERLRLAAGTPLYLTVCYSLLVLSVYAFLFVCKKLSRMPVFRAKSALYGK